MTRNSTRSFSISLLALSAILAFHQTAQCCPQLLCHSLDIENARSLPWSGSEFRDVKTDYDINRLVDDTLGLLGPDTPVIVRMETLRRATVYAVWAMFDAEVGMELEDLKIARELLERLQLRSREAKGKAEALALFDHLRLTPKP